MTRKMETATARECCIKGLTQRRRMTVEANMDFLEVCVHAGDGSCLVFDLRLWSGSANSKPHKSFEINR
jgi:hypothetical protein